MQYFIKICGVTNFEDIEELCKMNIDSIGFNRDKNSPRFVSLDFLKSASKYFNNKISPVIVFVNESSEEVKKAASFFKNPILQFHGDESKNFCSSFNLPYIKAISMQDDDYLSKIDEFKDAFAILLDSGDKKIRGGTGKTFDWLNTSYETIKPIMIAGGLNCDNVEDAIKVFLPYGVDVSSGVESDDGKKNLNLIREFIKKV